MAAQDDRFSLPHWVGNGSRQHDAIANQSVLKLPKVLQPLGIAAAPKNSYFVSERPSINHLKAYYESGICHVAESVHLLALLQAFAGYGPVVALVLWRASLRSAASCLRAVFSLSARKSLVL